VVYTLIQEMTLTTYEIKDRLLQVIKEDGTVSTDDISMSTCISHQRLSIFSAAVSV